VPATIPCLCDRLRPRAGKRCLLNRRRSWLDRSSLDLIAHVRILSLNRSRCACRSRLVLRDSLRLRNLTRGGRSCPLDRRNHLLGGLTRRQGYLARSRCTLEILLEIIISALAAASGQRQCTGHSCQADDFTHMLLQVPQMAVIRSQDWHAALHMAYPEWQWPVRCIFPLERSLFGLFLSTHGDILVSIW